MEKHGKGKVIYIGIKKQCNVFYIGFLINYKLNF